LTLTDLTTPAPPSMIHTARRTIEITWSRAHRLQLASPSSQTTVTSVAYMCGAMHVMK